MSAMDIMARLAQLEEKQKYDHELIVYLQKRLSVVDKSLFEIDENDPMLKWVTNKFNENPKLVKKCVEDAIGCCYRLQHNLNEGNVPGFAYYKQSEETTKVNTINWCRKHRENLEFADRWLRNKLEVSVAPME